MKVHLVDGTYELFRHHFGQPSRLSPDGIEVAATRGVLLTTLSMLSDGATHLGVATDHVIASFRNDLWPGYKTDAGMPEELKAQFPLVELALEALGVTVWPMVELEADDALASAAALCVPHPEVEQVVICTPDKDLAQCVAGRRVVQLNRRDGSIVDEAGVLAKYGVLPESIPDWLALVGDTADGFPGLAGWGKRSASTVLHHYRSIEAIPTTRRPGTRGPPGGAGGREVQRRDWHRDVTRRRSSSNWPPCGSTTQLLHGLDELRGRGPTAAFPAVCSLLGDPGLQDRAAALAARTGR